MHVHKPASYVQWYSVFLSERPKYMKAQSFWYGSSAKILVWRATISFYIAHFLFYVVGHDHQTSIWQSTTRMFSSRLQSVISRLARHLVFWINQVVFSLQAIMCHSINELLYWFALVIVGFATGSGVFIQS